MSYIERLLIYNLYDGGFFVGEKDSREYLDFVKSVFKKADVK